MTVSEFKALCGTNEIVNLVLPDDDGLNTYETLDHNNIFKDYIIVSIETEIAIYSAAEENNIQLNYEPMPVAQINLHIQHPPKIK